MSIPCEMLLHPELLSNEQLSSVILERHLRVPNIESMNRDALLELFHNFCVPYGQRRSRENGRGRPRQDPEEPMETGQIHDNNHRKHNLQSIDRIKPPPDILSGHMKRIKINGNLDVRNVNGIMEQSTNKRKIESQATAMSTSSPSSAKKARKPISWP